MQKSSIEWTDFTSNPLRARHAKSKRVGWHCVKVSPGCAGCYAEPINKRFGTHEEYNRASGREIELFVDEAELTKLVKTPGKGRKIFINDMTDLFQDDVADGQLDMMFDAFEAATSWQIQLLTKRAERGRDYLRSRWTGSPPDHIWYGVSAENQDWWDRRVPLLRETPAATRFVSAEPLLGPIGARFVVCPECKGLGYVQECHDFCTETLTCPYCQGSTQISWVIIGAMSGPGATPLELDWVQSLIRECQEAGVAPYVKQLGKTPIMKTESRPPTQEELFAERRQHGTTVVIVKETRLRLKASKGGDWSEWPESLRVREFPSLPAPAGTGVSGA